MNYPLVFNKLYLSNSRTNCYPERLDNFAKGGLVYISNSSFKSNNNFSNLVVDELKTRIARKMEKNFNLLQIGVRRFMRISNFTTIILIN